MNKITTYDELISEYRGLIELSPESKLIWAYKLGQLDGQIDVLNRQALARDFESFEELPAIRPLVGRA